MIKKFVLCASVSSLMLAASPVQAADNMSSAEMQKQLMLLSSQVEALTKVVKQQDIELKKQKQESAEAIANIEPASGGIVGDVKISMKPSPKIESTDGKYSFQPFGRVHLDLSMFDDDKKDHSSNANFRRTRIGFKGKLGDDLKYKSEFEFAGESINYRDVYLTYTGLDFADIKLGSQKPAFGMEQNTSSNYIMFMERAAPTNAFTRQYEIGANAVGGGDNWSLAAGVFNEDAGNKGTGEDEDITFDVRGSANILGLMNNDSKNVLHLGLGVSHRRPTGTVSFSAKPAGDGDKIVNTGSISAVDTVNVYGLEAAAVFGPASFQGEYFRADVNRSNGNTDADFDGYYAQAGWILTGETRPYKGKKGNFGRLKPAKPFNLKEGGWGAWELLARYENLDLNDNSASINGGELDNVSVGLNWHLNDRVRLMANVVDVDTDSNAVVADDDPTLYNFRAQWDF